MRARPPLAGISRHRVEPMEAANGILVAGMNTAILFAIRSSVARRQAGYDDLYG